MAAWTRGATYLPGGRDLERTVRIGVGTTVLVFAVLDALPFLPGHEPVDLRPYLDLLAAATGMTALLWLQRDRLFAGRHGYRLLYLWSLADIGLVSAGVALSGGGRSPLYLCYALTSLFVTSCYPWRAQIAIVLSTVLAYGVTLALGAGPVDAADLVVRSTMLVLITALGATIAREKDRNAAESARRAALLGTVAGVAREVSGAESGELLEAVVRATEALGFEHAYVSMLDEPSGRARVLCHRNLPAALAEDGLPIGSGVTAMVRRELDTVWLPDYASSREAVPEVVAAGVGAAVGSPIFVDGTLVGVLAAGTVRGRDVSAEDREAFELLAEVASRAFDGARRFEQLAESEARLRHVALHDELTGLANRSLFHSRVDEALGAQEAAAGVSLMLLDLDGFKRVNDTLGHAAGDELLAGVAARVASCLRPADTVARLSGDEFGVVVCGLGDDEVEALGRRVLAAISAPFRAGGRRVTVHASLGVARASAAVPAGDRDAVIDRLLSEADVAMYEAKRGGKGRCVVFDRTMRERVSSRLVLEDELSRAVEAGEMTVVYQPIVELASGGVVGFEALVRWHSERLGPVRPSEFIPIAEQSGAIGEIGSFVLRRSCEALQELRRANGAWCDLSMSVNLSTRQLADPGLVEEVLVLLAETWTPSWCLTLEITESALLEDAAACEAKLEALAALGISVALDDFGTGYSSLAYLQDLKVHALKIDRSFVVGLDRSPVAPALVRSIVQLADALGLVTVAEGVENEAQLAALRELGCRRGQGYLLSEPLPAEALAGFLTPRQVLGARPPSGTRGRRPAGAG